MAGRLAGNVMRPKPDAVLLTSFPARGLPQSGSKGLSQSMVFQPPTPLANATRFKQHGPHILQETAHCLAQKNECPLQERAPLANVCRSLRPIWWSVPGMHSAAGAASHKSAVDQKTIEFWPYSPSLWCSSVEVVVYCSRVFSSGRSRATAPKAASVASWKPQRMSFFLPG